MPDLGSICMSNRGICTYVLFHFIPNWGLPLKQYFAVGVAGLWAGLLLAILDYQGQHYWLLWGCVSDPLGHFQLAWSSLVLEGTLAPETYGFHLAHVTEPSPSVQDLLLNYHLLLTHSLVLKVTSPQDPGTFRISCTSSFFIPGLRSIHVCPIS